jgi:phosphatidylinositol alpha-mannosyltransferase
LQLGACYAVILAFKLSDKATIAAAAAILLAVNVTAVLPPTPSNVGIFQAACIAVLAAFGVAASRALAYGIVLQAVEVTAAVALGVPSLLYEGLSLGALRRAARSLQHSPTLTDKGATR